MAIIFAQMNLTWSFKVFYGLISDNLPICGSRRKSYIMIMGILQFSCMASIFAFDVKNAKAVSLLLSSSYLAIAFSNVCCDAILCAQARKDPEYGSQELTSLAWMVMSVGGLVGSLLGGLITQYIHPKWAFFIFSFSGFIVFF